MGLLKMLSPPGNMVRINWVNTGGRRWISSQYLMHGIMIVVNNTFIIYLKFIKRLYLKCSKKETMMWNCEVLDNAMVVIILYIAIYMCIKSTHCAP